MKIGVKVKENIARTIAEHFTTNEIVNVFIDANITADQSLSAKWRITLDAFGKISTEEGFFHILEEFCHPLNFEGKETTRKDFIDALKKILSYEDIEIKTTDKEVEFIRNDCGWKTSLSKPEQKIKTSIDYVVEAITFFKNEYNKAKISGLVYEYSLGENIDSHNIVNGRDEYEEKFLAIEQLKNARFIIEYEIKCKVESEGCYAWDYAICKIDESKITQKEAPSATEAGVQALTQKVIHEHTHQFKNSIQEKNISLTHKIIEENVISQTLKNKKNDLKSAEIKYDDDNATLEIGNKKCQIPPYKNEHYFCRAMYEHGTNEPIDWSGIYEKMTGYYEAYYGKPSATRANWRVVYDTMDALNKRIKEVVNTDDELFIWQEKTVKRNY